MDISQGQAMIQDDRRVSAPAAARPWRWLIVMSLCMPVLLSCVCSASGIPDILKQFTDRKNDASNPALTADADLLMAEDFSDPGSGWESGEFEGGSLGYQGGKYVVVSSEQYSVMWGTAGRIFSDAEIEVEADAQRLPKNNNNDFGVMCRVQYNGDGYSMNISSDGMYAIQRFDQGKYTDLVEWSESDMINIGKDVNHIRAVCSGSRLALYVNGTLLAEVRDTTYSEGDIALFATTYETTATEIHFDHLTVRKPK